MFLAFVFISVLVVGMYSIGYIFGRESIRRELEEQQSEYMNHHKSSRL